MSILNLLLCNELLHEAYNDTPIPACALIVLMLAYAGASSGHKRRRISSTYTERLRNLPSASQMSQVDMRQQQGCLHYDFVLRQPLLKTVTEPLYLNYRCEARQVTISQQMETCGSWVVCLVILHQVLIPCVQVPIKLLHPIFGRFVHLSETLTPDPSILFLVEELCASARYYYAGEKHYQPVLEQLLQRFLNTVEAGTLHRIFVGANNSTTDTALVVGL